MPSGARQRDVPLCRRVLVHTATHSPLCRRVLEDTSRIQLSQHVLVLTDLHSRGPTHSVRRIARTPDACGLPILLDPRHVLAHNHTKCPPRPPSCPRQMSHTRPKTRKRIRSENAHTAMDVVLPGLNNTRHVAHAPKGPTHLHQFCRSSTSCLGLSPRSCSFRNASSSCFVTQLSWR